jgi:phage gpG-like protein
VGTRFTFSFEGEVQIDRTIARVIDAVTDMRPVWEKLATRFAAVERRQFASEGGYGSGGWPALSPAYAAWKAANYPGRPILERTGTLKRSLTSRPFGVEVLDARSFAVGSGIDYGRFHQAGAGNLPRRRPVELPESERREWVRLMQRFIVTGNV